MADQGIFIVLEGADGSGKGTQFKLLAERLKAVGYDVEVFDFPRYDEPSSHFVRSYLNGEYGDASEISPYTASLFFALDRYEASPKIKKALKDGKIVLSNRFVGSNMAHQGGKFTNTGEQRGFFIWEDGLEFELLGIPRPTLNVFLRVPAEVSYQLIGKKSKRSYTENTHDEHEGDINHLRNSIKTYDTLCELFPKDFKAIECAPEGSLLSIAKISDLIWSEIKSTLPPKPPHAGHEVVFSLDDDKKSSSVKDQSAARETLAGSDDNLTIDVNKISLLAATKIQAIPGIVCKITKTEWSSEDSYDFYTPVEMPQKIQAAYKKSMDKLSAIHKKMDIPDKTSVTPMAALCSIKIRGSVGEITGLISALRESSIDELRWSAEQLQLAANKLRPKNFSKDISKGDLMKKPENKLSKIAAKNIGQLISANTDSVILHDTEPRNEFSLLVDALYPYSSSSREDILIEIEDWNYDKKSEALSAALEESTGYVLNLARYRWSLTLDHDTFTDVSNIIQVENLQAQPNTPRYGYNVPERVEQSGYDELFIECFDESLKLYSALQDAGYEYLAEYATLLGHKKRWQFNTNAKAFLFTDFGSISKEARDVFLSMREKVAENHPIIGNFLSKHQPKPHSAKPKHQVQKSQPPKKPASSYRKRRSRKPKK